MVQDDVGRRRRRTQYTYVKVTCGVDYSAAGTITEGCDNGDNGAGCGSCNGTTSNWYASAAEWVKARAGECYAYTSNNQQVYAQSTIRDSWPDCDNGACTCSASVVVAVLSGLAVAYVNH